MNGNPFYVQPASPLSGLQSLLSGATEGALAQKERDEEAAKKDKMSQFSEMFQQATPTQVSQFILENPEVAENIKGALSTQGVLEDKQMAEMSWQILTNPDQAPQILGQMAERKLQAGEDASQIINLYQNAMAGGDAAVKGSMAYLSATNPQGIATYLKSTGESEADVPAGTKEFEDLIGAAGLTPEEKAVAARIKLGLSPRAVGSADQTITEKGTAQEVAVTKETLKQAEEQGKLLAQYKLKPQVESAVIDAVAAATAKAEGAKEEKSNKRAFDVYNTAMTGLVSGLQGATTNPVVGFLPAVTSSQQVAEGAVAAMAPVLKQLFRAAGEGIFTDKDQELLLAMVPTRKDLPSARAAKLSNIDAIVRAKLGITDQTGFLGEVSPKGPPTVTTQAEYDALPSGAVFVEDGQTYRKP